VHRWLRRTLLAVLVGLGAATPVHGAASAGGSTRLVDDTGTIALRVPDDWRDIDLSPGMADDGHPRGRIAATPDRFELQASGHVPFVWATVVPAPVDPDAWLANNTRHGSCIRGAPEVFDNGLVLGTRITWTACGDRKARLVQIAARSKRNDRDAVVVQVMLPRIDDGLLDLLLGSVEVLPEPATAEEAPTTADSIVLADRPPISFVFDHVPADAVPIIDDTFGLAISVPPGFTDTQTLYELNDDGSPRPTLIAAPDLDDFLANGRDGVLVTRLPYVDPVTLLDNATYPFCRDGGFFTVSTGAYKGLARMSEDCDGPIDGVASVALVPPDRSATVLLDVALPDDDLTVLQIAIASVELL
jgi:hypothetical protein